MREYKNLVRRILSNGQEYPDRTQTGCLGIFGHQMRFDLAEGFPLVTVKRTWMKGVVHELLWMLRGETNIACLQKEGVHIWDEWADEDGNLGPVYGHQWVKWGAKPTSIAQRPPQLPTGVEPTYLGVANGAGKEGHPLKKTWEGMIARCYDVNNIGYKHYGGRGVSVCDRWLVFANFAEDAIALKGYERKVAGERVVLDKDIAGGGFLYSPESCQWVSDSENQLARSTRRITVEGADGRFHTFTNPTEFCREQGISNKNFSDLWTGTKNARVRHGFRLVDIVDEKAGVNQLAVLLRGLECDPFSRRHIISAWAPGELPVPGLSPQQNVREGKMALAPCHCLVQFHVSLAPCGSKVLSCQLYQRSADVFLGVPFNIASYALLTHMLAYHLDMLPGEFIWTGGDCHLYSNHVELARMMLTRQPKARPLLRLNYHRDRRLWDVQPDEIEVAYYNPHPSIPAKVAV